MTRGPPAAMFVMAACAAWVMHVEGPKPSFQKTFRKLHTDRAATATFQQLPGATFTVNGATPSADAALVSFGAGLDLGRGWTLSAGFDGEFSRTTSGYAGKGSLRYAW